MIRFPNPVSSASFEFRVVYYLTHMISFMPEQIKQVSRVLADKDAISRPQFSCACILTIWCLSPLIILKSWYAFLIATDGVDNGLQPSIQEIWVRHNLYEQKRLRKGPHLWSLPQCGALCPLQASLYSLSQYHSYQDIHKVFSPGSALIRSRIIREIEISHWGNIAFEEAVFARNDAAPLLGEWSRHDFDNSFYKSSIKDRSWCMELYLTSSEL